MTLGSSAAIVGIGATEFSKNSGRSELRLAVEATIAALHDAGLGSDEIDGVATYTLDNTSEIQLFNGIGGHELKFYAQSGYGGCGSCGPVHYAAMAVATGVANVIVCYRALNERSQYRFGRRPPPTADDLSAAAITRGLHTVHGLRTPAAMVALGIQRYVHEFGVTPADLGSLAVSARRYAATNPNAWFFGKPITLEDYLGSRLIADPLRLFDCCQESDGAVAVIVTSMARAKDLKQRPVVIRASAQGACNGQQVMTNYYRPDIWAASESALVGKQLYRMGGLTPADIDVAIIYDHFLPTILPQLEAYGFCGRGEARDYIRDDALGPAGRLPVNPHGGQVGEAYIHGMNGIAEAVRQLRGTAANQIVAVENILVTAAVGGPTSGLLLGVD